eukprot:TRINITY_DN1559_c0_g2_i1.p1 TRINITY_DN1559_c0_g2~~TRINITY_DN1559_c0_g2_i1.p1  ORF type:complete len:112 (-),score=35.22 TRINITY_DN1559_c0_g2_i1:188-496(-)
MLLWEIVTGQRKPACSELREKYINCVLASECVDEHQSFQRCMGVPECIELRKNYFQCRNAQRSPSHQLRGNPYLKTQTERLQDQKEERQAKGVTELLDDEDE